MIDKSIYDDVSEAIRNMNWRRRRWSIQRAYKFFDANKDEIAWFDEVNGVLWMRRECYHLLKIRDKAKEV